MGLLKFLDDVNNTLNAVAQLHDGITKTNEIINSDDGVVDELHYKDSYKVHPIYLESYGKWEIRLTQPLFSNFYLYIANTDHELIIKDESENTTSICPVIGEGNCFAVVKSARGSGKYSLTIKKVY